MSAFGRMRDYFLSHGMGRAFRHRDFRLFFFAGWVSNVGIWFQRLGVQWLAWSMTGSYAWLGAIAAIDALMTVLFLPLFGTMTDRKDRLVLARQAQAALLLLGFALAVLTTFDLVTIWVLFAMMGLHGIAEAFWTPNRMAMPPALVPREDLAAAIGAGAVGFNLAQFIGPVLAGVILLAVEKQMGIGWDATRTGVALLFWLNILSFIGYFVVLFMIELTRENVSAKNRQGFVKDFTEGIRYVAAKSGLGLFAILILASMLFTRASREQFAGYADGVFSQGATGLAWLTAANAVGGIIGSLLVGNIKDMKGIILLIMIALGLSTLFSFGIAAANVFWLGVFFVAANATVGSFGSITGQVVVQHAIDGDMRGRVMGLWSMIIRGGPASGAYLVGIIAGFWELQAAFAATAFLFLLVWLWIWPKRKYMAEHLETSQDDIADSGSKN